MIDANRLQDILFACLLGEDLRDEINQAKEEDKEKARELLHKHNVKMVEGLLSKFVLRIDEVEKHREEIQGFISQLSPDFSKHKGGGTSFLNLCFTAKGEQWGEHRSGEILVVLAIALDLAGYCLPKEIWGALPGGVPYIWFDFTPEPT